MNHTFKTGVFLMALFALGAMANAQTCQTQVVDARGTPVTVRSTERIVSLNGTTTEILYALGVGDRLVGRDTSSYYPPEVQKLPDVGYQFRLNAEGILALRPTLVIGREDVKPPQVIEQLRVAGVAVVLVPDAPTIEGAKAKIRAIARAVCRASQGEALVRAMERDLLVLESKLHQRAHQPKARALFLYLRGPKTTFVCGAGTNPAGMIELAGAENAAAEIQGCKPMTAEAVISARPDVLVLFTHGLESIGGVEGLLKLPGVALTPAGRNRRIVALDDLYLGGFGPRTGRAALDLFHGIYEAQGVYVREE